MKIPQAVKPTKKQLAAFKSYLRALAALGTSYIIHKFGIDPAASVIIGTAIAPILKWLDPQEKSLGIGSHDGTSA